MTGGLLLMSVLASAEAAPSQWPQWRGPDGRGVTSATGLPVHWSKSDVLWKLELPGRSAATPALWDDRLFLSTPENANIQLWCVSTSGKVLWKKTVGVGDKKLGFNGKNNFATPSPMTDGHHVWLLVGSGDMRCFDVDGNEVWHRNLSADHGPFTQDFGIGASCLLWRDRIFVPCLHRRAMSHVLAIDKKTGKDLWKIERPTDAEEESKDAYSTPALFDPEGERPELILCGADLATAYDPQTGKELWRHGDINPTRNKTLRIIVTPVATNDLILVNSAKRGPMYAIRPGGSGDVRKTHRVWTHTVNTPDVATPAVLGNLVFLVQERGVVTCLDLATGKEHWHERVAAGYFGSSPLIAEGRLYVTSENGKVYVLAADKQYKKLAENDLEDVILASPVPAPGRLYFRTEHWLLCIGGRQGSASR